MERKVDEIKRCKRKMDTGVPLELTQGTDVRIIKVLPTVD